jgi:Tol biopolymer transport system component
LTRADPVTAGGLDVWLVDADKEQVPTRFTSSGAGSMPTTWSPDGKIVAFTRDKLYLKNTETGEEKPFKPEIPSISDWSKDGRLMIAFGKNEGTGFDLQVISASGDGTPAWFKAPFNQGNPRISPDGKWLAYTSDETGRLEIYLQRFPQPADKQLVSQSGGYLPRWRADGKELFYIAQDLKVMSVAIDPSTGLPAAPPRALFQAPVLTGIYAIGTLEPFDVSPDGQRFLLIPLNRAPNTSISLIMNWDALLKR